MDQFPDDGHHMMHYAGLRSGYHEFLCETCGRHVLIHSNPARVDEGDHTFVVLKRGAFWAFHSGESDGLAADNGEMGLGQADVPPTCPSITFEAGSGQGPSTGSGRGPDEDWAELSDDELTEEWKTWLVEILDDIL
jgi:hypothetical protein